MFTYMHVTCIGTLLLKLFCLWYGHTELFYTPFCPFCLPFYMYLLPLPFPPLLGLSSMPTCQHSPLPSQGLSRDGSSRWIKRLITKPSWTTTHATHAHTCTFPCANWCRREWGSMRQMSSTSPTWYWMPGEGVDIVSLQDVYTYGCYTDSLLCKTI